jgi:predicted DNA-binding transcriptional regulator AlpA
MSSSTDGSVSDRLLLRAEETAPLLGLSLRELYRVAAIPSGQPGALPAGIVLKIGRRVRFSRLRLLEWLGTEPNGQTPP